MRRPAYLDGDPSATNPADQAKQAQNRAKNEFCAWQNTDPALVTRFSFDQRQKQSTASIGLGDSPSIDVCEFKTLATCRVDREDVDAV